MLLQRDFSALLGNVVGISDRALKYHLDLYNKYVQDLNALEATYPLFENSTVEPILKSKIKDLDLVLTGPIVEILNKIDQELNDKGLTSFRPEFVISDDDFFTADRAISIGIPWFLANKNLWDLALRSEEFNFTPEEVEEYLRHEIGHAFNYAFELWKDPEWTGVFGDFNRPYNEEFKADPDSTDFVYYIRNVADYYAQKHPDESFSEAFATWLDPKVNWKEQYATWPGALEKLHFIDNLMSKVALRSPTNMYLGKPVPYTELSGTVQEGLKLPKINNYNLAEFKALLESQPQLYASVVLHQLYFEQFGYSTHSSTFPLLDGEIVKSFGSYENFNRDFRMVCSVGNGWAISYWDPLAQRIKNSYLPEDSVHLPANCKILLACDLHEHAYLMDSPNKIAYLGAFFGNLNLEVVESRLELVKQSE